MVKKILFFGGIICLILLAGGCTENSQMKESNELNSEFDPKTTGDWEDKYDYELRRSLEIENTSSEEGRTKAASENQETNNEEEKNMRQSNEKIDPNQFEDLVSEYEQAIIKTNFGAIKVRFYNQDSPTTVNNFLNLAKLDFYDKTLFHRIIPDFMIQGGDPLSKDDNPANDGTGDPGYKFPDEFNQHKLVKGSFAMANSGPDTNGSQFFIVTKESTPWLDGKHTNFGEVVEGMDVVERIEALPTDQGDRPLQPAMIESIELIEASVEEPVPAGPSEIILE